MQKIIVLLIAMFFVGTSYGAPAGQPTMAVLPFQLRNVHEITS